MDIIPWEKSEHHDTYKSQRGRYAYFSRYGRTKGHKSHTYHRTIEYLDDNPRQFWRKGDIVKFDDGIIYPWGETWEKWFMIKEDWLKTLPRHGRTPKYASEEYAVITGRYRVIKYKFGYEFKDYGIIIMMLTGPKKGHIRKYYIKYPFDIVSVFPYISNPPLISTELIDSFIEHHENSNKSRNAFLECLYKKLMGEISL